MIGIATYGRIEKNAYSVNGKKFELFEVNSFMEFLTLLYKELSLDYRKFHKMDLLSKTAYLGSELMLAQKEPFQDENTALIFANSESSKWSDEKFLNSYKSERNPSPSHFVYTLPNILIGEIAIKNKWYGENLFLIFPKFDAHEFTDQIKVILSGDVQKAVCGWVNITENNIDAFFFMVEKNPETGMDLTPENLLKLYTFRNG